MDEWTINRFDITPTEEISTSSYAVLQQLYTAAAVRRNSQALSLSRFLAFSLCSLCCSLGCCCCSLSSSLLLLSLFLLIVVGPLQYTELLNGIGTFSTTKSDILSRNSGESTSRPADYSCLFLLDYCACLRACVRTNPPSQP